MSNYKTGDMVALMSRMRTPALDVGPVTRVSGHSTWAFGRRFGKRGSEHGLGRNTYITHATPEHVEWARIDALARRLSSRLADLRAALPGGARDTMPAADVVALAALLGVS